MTNQNINELNLIQDPYFTGMDGESWYEAIATDAAGKEYLVKWDIDPDADLEDGDEGDNCDWDNPASIEEI